MTLMVFLNEYFEKKIILKKNQQSAKIIRNFQACKDSSYAFIAGKERKKFRLSMDPMSLESFTQDSNHSKISIGNILMR